MKTEKTFAETVKRYRILKNRDREIQEELKELRSDILNYMDSIDSTQESGRTWTVSISSRTSMIFDKDALKSTLGQDLSQWQKPSTSKVLIVK